MNENETRAIVLFFSLAYLDEASAVEAAGRAFSHLADQVRRRRSKAAPAELVASLHHVIAKNPEALRAAPAADSSAHWTAPPGIDLAKWREFRKASPPDETEVLILANVLGFAEADVARGLGLTEGTVRYRQGRALSRLGALAPRPALRSL